jgi:hypothetical protein
LTVHLSARAPVNKSAAPENVTMKYHMMPRNPAIRKSEREAKPFADYAGARVAEPDVLDHKDAENQNDRDANREEYWRGKEDGSDPPPTFLPWSPSRLSHDLNNAGVPAVRLRRRSCNSGPPATVIAPPMDLGEIGI